ncbi:MAG: TIGR03086 family metal-binding protein, partial [Acidimicrobiales bacterium]
SARSASVVMRPPGRPGAGAIDPIALHEGALDATGRIIARVRQDQLTLPTPCAEWDVGLLIEHLVDGNEMFTAAVVDRTSRPTAPEVDDPFDAYARSTEAVRQAWRQPGVLTREITGPFGTLPGHVVVRMHFVDHLVHGWDLAKATGQDTTIEERLATAAYEEMTAALDASSRGPGSPFGPEVPCSRDAPVHERLMAFLGRHP